MAASGNGGGKPGTVPSEGHGDSVPSPDLAPASTAPVTTPPVNTDGEPQAVSSWTRNLVAVALGLGIFVGILDATIVATIVPTVADEFHSGDAAGWYGAVYLLVTGATQPTFGKLYTIFSPKIIFLSSLAFLEVGSLVCALAHSSPAFIAGRAVAGLGAAGIISGALIIISLVTPIHLRPVYTSTLGSLEGIGIIAGPIIGGAIASNIGWRWCFWINLPIGAFLSVIILFLLRTSVTAPSDKHGEPPKTWRQRILEADIEGGIAIAGSLACLLLALQWGGTTYAWSDGRIIALFVVFGVSLICAGFYERRKGDGATFPTRLFKNRTLMMCVAAGFCLAGAQFVVLYYLPIWFQAVQGVSAEDSGVRLLAMILTVIPAAIIAGGGASLVGYLPPFMFLATILASTGAAMLRTFHPDIPMAKWIGYQVLYGSGSGMGVQQSIVGAQVAVSQADVAYATSAVMLGNTLSGAILIAVSQSLFLGELTKAADMLPGVGATQLLGSFTSFRQILPPQLVPFVIQAFNDGVTKTFTVALVLSCLSALTWPFFKWIPIKQKAKQDAEAQQADTETETKTETGTQTLADTEGETRRTVVETK